MARASWLSLLKYLYSEEGQEIAARNFYRPRSTAVPAALTKQFPKIKLYTIDDSFGGWTNRKRRISPMAVYSIRSISRSKQSNKHDGMKGSIAGAYALAVL